MRFKKAAALVLSFGLVLTGVGIAQEIKGSDEMSMRVWKVGEELKCLCGCAYTVASCNMINCHFREEVNPQIEEGLKAGLDPARIIEMLRAKYGSGLRTMPQAEGLGLVGWAMPFFALGIGLAIVPFVVRRWRQSQAMAPAAAPVDPAAVQRYTEQIDKELDDLV